MRNPVTLCRMLFDLCFTGVYLLLTCRYFIFSDISDLLFILLDELSDKAVFTKCRFKDTVSVLKPVSLIGKSLYSGLM